MKARRGFLIFALVALAAGIFLLHQSTKKAKICTVPATATVVDYSVQVTEDSDGTSTAYYPIVEFETENGTCQATYDVGTGRQEYATGSKIEIKYNADNPNEFLIEGDNFLKITGIVLLVIGILLLLGSIWNFIRRLA